MYFKGHIHLRKTTHISSWQLPIAPQWAVPTTFALLGQMYVESVWILKYVHTINRGLKNGLCICFILLVKKQTDYWLLYFAISLLTNDLRQDILILTI